MKFFAQPEVNHGEPEPDGERNETAADVHVVLVGHREDDDQQEEGAEDLVRCQGVQCHLGGLFSSIFTFLMLGFCCTVSVGKEG